MWEEYASAFRVARILEECVRSLNWAPGSDLTTQMWCVRVSAEPEMIARKEGLTIHRK